MPDMGAPLPEAIEDEAAIDEGGCTEVGEGCAPDTGALLLEATEGDPGVRTPLLEAIEAATDEVGFLEVFSFVPGVSINSKPSFIAL